MNERCLCAIFFTSIGAFVPGVPVQPVLVKYPNKLVSMNLTEPLYFCYDAFLLANANKVE